MTERTAKRALFIMAPLAVIMTSLAIWTATLPPPRPPIRPPKPTWPPVVQEQPEPRNAREAMLVSMTTTIEQARKDAWDWWHSLDHVPTRQEQIEFLSSQPHIIEAQGGKKGALIYATMMSEPAIRRLRRTNREQWRVYWERMSADVFLRAYIGTADPNDLSPYTFEAIMGHPIPATPTHTTPR